MTVQYADTPIELSPKEYQLLEYFLRHPRQVFNRAQLLDQLWSFGNSPEEATVKGSHARSQAKAQSRRGTGGCD